MDGYSRAVRLWQSYGVASGADLDKYLHSIRILFAYHSGKIENEEITYHDTREIFENGRVADYNRSPRALFEQQNQKMCYEFLKEKIVSREPLDIQLVNEMHQTLTTGTYYERRYIENEERPGEFKKHDYVTGVHEVGSSAEDMEKEVAELIAEIDAYKGDDVLKAAAWFHARFEYIHPFAEGNGRVGRTLLNYYLVIRDHPPLIVHDEEKGRYYAALRQYDEAEDLPPLYEFFRYETEKTWAKALTLLDGAQPD